MEAYIDEFKDLIDLSGYTDPIAIILKFHRELNSMTQDRIAESGTDRLCKGNLTDLRRILHLSLAKGNPK
jgi:hypothetical protein